MNTHEHIDVSHALRTTYGQARKDWIESTVNLKAISLYIATFFFGLIVSVVLVDGFNAIYYTDQYALFRTMLYITLLPHIYGIIIRLMSDRNTLISINQFINDG